ncbi:MAG: hypothetical protein JWP89_1792 [Schlesneria sp.]|nr:hypothetical protein [Schlesneria sp.]
MQRSFSRNDLSVVVNRASDRASWLASSRSAMFAALFVILAGCGKSTPKPSVGEVGKESAVEVDTTPAIENPRDIALRGKATLTVSSNPPGCLVLVDLVPVKNENEGLALTPCEVVVATGSHSISVERAGGRRATQVQEIQADRELEFDVSSETGELDEAGVWNAPLFEAAVGRPIALTSLNTRQKELDPFIAVDGLTIYFVSDRDGTKGVYVATRPSPYHDFESPKVISASSGADLPISPSVTTDGLMLVYAIPEKSRLWQLTRKNAEAPFDGKEIARADEQGERPWRSSQLSSDGLRLYWTEETEDSLLTRAAVRSASNKLFGKTLAFELPGHHPHLSSDGLRQYSFDGTVLKRARRGNIRQPFGELEVVTELQLDGYVANSQYRQFWLTEDEQWMYYCNNPKGLGDLFVVRLSDGPGWGRSYVGKTVADKMAVAATEPEMKPLVDAAQTETVDPRTLPLSYTTHWAKLTKLLEDNQGDEAVALVKEALADKNLEGDRELLNWDLTLAEALAEFNQDVQRGLQALKPGTPVRVAGTKFEFGRVEGELLHLKLKDKEVVKKLSDLSPGERISIAETGLEKAAGPRALRYAIYLYFQGKLNQANADNWFKRAEDEGDKFRERLAYRVFHQGQSELARGNTAAAITFLDAVPNVSGPNTDAAKQAAKVRDSLYEALVWKEVGKRTWKRGDQGEFTADGVRANDSYLVSEKEYSDFELTCEWQVFEPNAMGGIYFRYSGKGKPLENGAKIHLANDADLRKMDRFATGALFAVASPDANASHPSGQWNTLKIQVRGTAVKVWINDKPVQETTLPKAVPDNGIVMLDGVIGGISYRKVLLFDLTSSK